MIGSKIGIRRLLFYIEKRIRSAIYQSDDPCMDFDQIAKTINEEGKVIIFVVKSEKRKTKIEICLPYLPVDQEPIFVEFTY